MSKPYKYNSSVAAWSAMIAEVLGLFTDGYMLMLALGGIAARLSLPWLAIDYWTCVLIMVAAYAVLPSTTGISIRLTSFLREHEAKQ